MDTILGGSSKEIFFGKKVQQIISFIGEGKLKDNSMTSKEFREVLDVIPTNILIKYAEECLSESFTDSGLVLQDIVNQVGMRLGFDVLYGRYRGTSNEIGFDGLWNSKDGFSIILEVKTTDAFRINLDTIVKYRKELIDGGSILADNSSILIVVGRQDTGDLEAQIRGSRHAWDVRLISTDALLTLLTLKEKLNDAKTSHQINSALRPIEYTKIDKLIELIFVTAKDLELDDEENNEQSSEQLEDKAKENELLIDNNKKNKNKVDFHRQCVEVISTRHNKTFIKESKSLYKEKGGNIGFSLAISKRYDVASYNAKYWYAFHPYQKEFLEELQSAYAAFGCGGRDKVFMIPLEIFNDLLPYMWTTEKSNRMYWHIVIFESEDKYFLQAPKRGNFIDITSFKI